MKIAGALLAVSAAALAGPLAAAAQEAHVANMATAKLEPFPNVPDCMRGSAVHGDPSKGPSTILVRGTAHCRVPRHWHTANESVMFVAGAAQMTMQGQPRPEILRPGSFAYVPGKHQHALTCTTNCSFFINADAAFDIHYVDDSGSEIPFEKAVPQTKARPAGTASKSEH